MKKKVAFFTLGCKVNQYETQQMKQEFLRFGYEVVGDDEQADVYVVNSCSVTRLADRKSRQYIRRSRKNNPDAVIVCMGCYPETNPEEVSDIKEVDIIMGTVNKTEVVSRVTEFMNSENISAYDTRQSAYGDSKVPVFSPTDPECRTRGLIQIQNGCNRFCSYCVIPYARHELTSKPVEEIVEEAKKLISSGYKEIVLTGINTALYEGGVGKVIEALNNLPGDFRIRLGSLEPTVVDAEYVAGLMKYDKLCHHVHMSVQSGSNKIISSMNRHYTREEYLKIVDVLRSVDPHYGITTDIITGFPGETEEDFQQSMELVREVGFLKVHGFPYSRRLFTPAADMQEQIAPPVKKERNKRLIEFSEEVSKNFRKSMTGSVQKVLAEEMVNTPYTWLWKGHADNFCPVYFRYDGNPSNEYVNIKVVRPFMDGVYGEEDKMDDCLFCKIANHEIPTTVLYEDDKILCFPDITPQAPVHVLMIPKKHIGSLNELTAEDSELIAYMMQKVKEIAAMQGLDEGYRTVINTGENGGQTVKHLHIHILGGRFMTWPPG